MLGTAEKGARRSGSDRHGRPQPPKRPITHFLFSGSIPQNLMAAKG